MDSAFAARLRLLATVRAANTSDFATLIIIGVRDHTATREGFSRSACYFTSDTQNLALALAANDAIVEVEALPNAAEGLEHQWSHRDWYKDIDIELPARLWIVASVDGVVGWIFFAPFTLMLVLYRASPNGEDPKIVLSYLVKRRIHDSVAVPLPLRS